MLSISSPPWLLMLVSLAITVPLAYFLNIRFDEAFTLTTTSDGVVSAFKQAIGFGQQAPLYFVLVAIWRSMDQSIFFARLFSVACLPLFVWIAAEVSKRYLKGVNPLFVAAIAAVHQQAVWNALDIRLYAMMMVLSGLLLLLFYDGYLSERPARQARTLFVIVAILSLYTQYYLGFQLVAGAVVLFALMRWNVLFRYILHMAIVGVLFIPMLVIIGGQFSEVTGQIDTPLSIIEVFRIGYQQFLSLLVPAEWVQLESVRPWILRIFVFAIAVFFAVKIARDREPEDVALAGFSLVLIVFFLFALRFAGFQVTQQRHMSGLILPLVMIPFASLKLFKDLRIVRVWFTIAMALTLAALFFTYQPMAKPGDFDRVAHYVMANEQPDQPVLVFHADAILPLRYYYSGQNPLIALPQENDTEKWDPRRNVLKDEAQILEVINRQPNSPERFWLVHDGWCAHGSLKFNCNVLESVVDKYFVVESSRGFFEPTTVRLLRRK